jgi:DNA-binding transcriptional regulator YhcF (GntR family)
MASRTTPPPEILEPHDLQEEHMALDDGLEPLEPDTLVIENEVLRQGFTIIPNYVLKDPSISPGAKTTFMLLLSYAWQEGSCFPGQERLARELGVAKRSIIRWLQELEEHEVISSKRRGLGKTNLYTILDKKSSPAPSVTSRSDKLSQQELTKTTIQEVPKTAHKENTQNKNTEQQPVVVANQRRGKEKKGNNSSSEQTQPSEVTQDLTEVGISITVAKRLASRYKAERIYEKLDYLQFLQEKNPRKVSNPRGWLRTAIEQDFGPPDGYKSPGEREKEAAEEERQREERDAWLQMQEKRPIQQSWTDQLIDRLQIPEEFQRITRELQGLLKQQMTAATFGTWVSRILITEIEDDRVSIAVPSTSAYEWLANRLKDNFEDALTVILGESVSVDFAVIQVEKGSK